jgi:hypothetical protein
MITVGILVVHIVALIIFSAFPGSAASTGWWLVLGLGAMLALIGLVLHTQVPESPRWLLRHGRYDEVQGHGHLGVRDVSDGAMRRAPRRLWSESRAAAASRGAGPGPPACGGH